MEYVAILAQANDFDVHSPIWHINYISPLRFSAP